MLGTFSSMADLIIGLETDNVISGFMTQYLRSGEPYLNTPHGATICYWDGTAHYLMYIVILVALARRCVYCILGVIQISSDNLAVKV